MGLTSLARLLVSAVPVSFFWRHGLSFAALSDSHGWALGTVYLGTHLTTKSTVALKMVARKNIAGLKDSSDDIESPENKTARNLWKIEREIALMKLIKHPYILGLIDVLEMDNHL